MNSSTNGNPERIPFYLKIIAIFAALFFWQILSVCINSKIIIASPLDVVVRMTSIWREKIFWASIAFSTLRIVTGFFAGVLCAIILGLLSDRFRIVEISLWPYMVSIRSIPVASIVVICLIWLSAANLSWFISFLIVLPVVYENVLTGLKNRSEEIEDVAQIYGVTGLEKIRTVLIPQIMPFFVSACKVTAGMAWKAGVAAEVIATPTGSMGRQLYLAKTYLDTVDLFCWTLVIVVISVLFEKTFVFLLKKITGKWCGIEEL